MSLIDVRTPRTESGRRLMARELWEWLPEAYQMSHARLNDVIVAIEDEAADAASRNTLELVVVPTRDACMDCGKAEAALRVGETPPRSLGKGETPPPRAK